MAGHSVDVEQLRATLVRLDSTFSRVHDLVRKLDTLAVPAESFGGIGAGAADSYTGAHQRKISTLHTLVGGLRDAGSLTTNVINQHLAHDQDTAAAFDRLRWEQP